MPARDIRPRAQDRRGPCPSGGVRELLVYGQGNSTVSVSAEFRDPIGGSPIYDVCLDDSSTNQQPLMGMGVLPGADWSQVTGAVDYHRYGDRAGVPDGIVKTTLKPGDALSSKQIRVVGKCSNEPLPALPRR